MFLFYVILNNYILIFVEQKLKNMERKEITLINRISIFENMQASNETDKFICVSASGEELEGFAHYADAEDFCMNYHHTQILNDAISLLRKVLTQSGIESEFDEEIYDFLKSNNVLPAGYVPYFDNVNEEE